jgi:hypothetical protein
MSRRLLPSAWSVRLCIAGLVCSAAAAPAAAQPRIRGWWQRQPLVRQWKKQASGQRRARHGSPHARFVEARFTRLRDVALALMREHGITPTLPGNGYQQLEQRLVTERGETIHIQYELLAAEVDADDVVRVGVYLPGAAGDELRALYEPHQVSFYRGGHLSRRLPGDGEAGEVPGEYVIENSKQHGKKDDRWSTEPAVWKLVKTWVNGGGVQAEMLEEAAYVKRHFLGGERSLAQKFVPARPPSPVLQRIQEAIGVRRRPVVEE